MFVTQNILFARIVNCSVLGHSHKSNEEKREDVEKCTLMKLCLVEEYVSRAQIDVCT